MSDAHTSSSREDAPQSISPKAAMWIGLLAGGWIATMALVAVFVFADGTFAMRQAVAEDDGPSIPLPGGGQIPLPDFSGDDSTTIDPTDANNRPRGVTNPGGGTSDSNNRAIALSASIGGGESVVYFFDTVAQRVLVYQYAGRISSGNRPLRQGDRGGLRLLAARHFDFDMKLEGYRDLSQRTRNQLKTAFDSAMKKSGKKSGGGIPAKKIPLK